MRTFTIRTLSASIIEEAASATELVGVTNGGALVGVVVPIDERTVQRVIRRDRGEIAASIAEGEAELASGARLPRLADVLNEPPAQPRAESGGQRAGLTRVTIRELSGSRIEQAGAAGEVLLVMRERVALALLVPVTAHWVEDLVERNVAEFLDGGSDRIHAGGGGQGSAMHYRDESQSPIRRSQHRPQNRELLKQRVAGIKIISDPPDGRQRLVGVVTNMLAKVVAGPIEMPLETMDEVVVFNKILILVDELSALMGADDRLVGVGLEIGGHVHDGRVIYSANIDSASARWDHFPLAERLSDSLKLPVILQNDANALAVYELRFRGIDDLDLAVVLVTDSGVGCGLVLNGHVYHGVRGMAGELGHVPVGFNEGATVKCRCENPGCLEGIATPRAMQLSLWERGFEGTYEDALHMPEDERVRAVFEDGGAAMGRATAALINLLNLSAIVFYAPQHLFGLPRQFRIDTDVSVTGAARHYMNAMMADPCPELLHRRRGRLPLHCADVDRRERSGRGGGVLDTARHQAPGLDRRLRLRLVRLRDLSRGLFRTSW